MTPTDLDLVFGQGVGSASQRAARSTTKYVRSQVQLALYNTQAKGRILAASEALEDFGLAALASVHRDGTFPLVWKSGEPAETISARRKEMNISVAKLATATGLPKSVVEDAERPNKILPIRQLELIAQHLALDDRVLGFAPKANSDSALAVRLRQLQEQRDEWKFSESSVLKLAEAGWVVARQVALANLLGESTFTPFAAPDNNLSYPSWIHGRRLAAETRKHLQIDPTVPIPSLRSLLETTFHIPLVQQDLGERFAGATIANGNVRGIVVNERGANSNVWVRRMTMCHELGHLLWDPDQHLNRLTVDSYEDVMGIPNKRTDPVEIRANAFAIYFLAPPDAVKKIFAESSSDEDGLLKLTEQFGISMTASKYHAANVLARDLDCGSVEYPTPSAEWEAAENRALDYFPISSTPITRRGRFAYLVAEGSRRGFISSDTAASLLKSTSEQVDKHVDAIVDLTS